MKELNDLMKKIGKLTIQDYNKDFIRETHTGNYKLKAELHLKNEKKLKILKQYSSNMLVYMVDVMGFWRNKCHLCISYYKYE